MRVLVTGASGQLGAYLLRHVRQQGCDVVAWSGRSTGELFGATLVPVDLAQLELRKPFEQAAPDLVIHAAAMSAIADAAADPERAFRINAGATWMLAELAQVHKARLVYISTDLVFDGESAPYTETAAPRALSAYGASKVEGEPAVFDTGGLVIRVSLMYGPSLIGRPTFFDQQLEAMRSAKAFRLFEDEWRTPLDLRTAAAGIWQAATSDAQGILHLGGRERLSRLEMGGQIAELAGFDPASLTATSRLSVGGAEPRPRDVALDCGRFASLFPNFERPSFDEAVRRFLSDRQAASA